MLKHHVIKLLICFTSISAFAQDEEQTMISKGNWMIGGNMSLSAASGGYYFSFLINPKASYFVGEKFALGLSTTYAFEKGGGLKEQAVGIGPSARYYFKNSRLAPFAELDYNFSRTQTKLDIIGEEQKNSISYFGAGVGLNYFISKNIALEGVLKYNFNDPFTYNFNDVFNDGLFSLNVGLQFFIGKKK